MKPSNQTSSEPANNFEFAEEIAELDRQLAARHAAKAAEPRRDPRDAESRAAAAGNHGAWPPAGDRSRRGCVYSIGNRYPDPGEIEGEPKAEAIVMMPGSEEDADNLDLQAQILRAQGKLAWCRAEILALRAENPPPSPAGAEAEAIRAEVLSTLKELIPMARRNAKRGSPALLRLVSGVLKLKL